MYPWKKLLLCNKTTKESVLSMYEITCLRQQLDGEGNWGYFHSATTPSSANSKIDDSTHKTQIEACVEKQWKRKKPRTLTLQFKHGSRRYLAEANQYVALWFKKKKRFFQKIIRKINFPKVLNNRRSTVISLTKL